MTERVRVQIQTTGLGFLRRVASVSLRDKVRSLVIHEGLGVELLLLQKEPVEVVQACGKDAKDTYDDMSSWEEATRQSSGPGGEIRSLH